MAEHRAAGKAQVMRYRRSAWVASRTGLNKAAARDAVDSMFATTGEALANGEEVRVAGFGTFAASKGSVGPV